MRGFPSPILPIYSPAHSISVVRRIACPVAKKRCNTLVYFVTLTPPQDLLSADDDVLTDALVYHKPPARRLPPLILTRLLADVAEYVVEGGGGLLAWYHRTFREASRRRYLGDRARCVRAYAALADYWCGRWAEEAKPPLTLAKISQVLEAPSCGAPVQPARFGGGGYKESAGLLDGPPNLRMLAERMPALLSLLALFREDPSAAPPNHAYYRAALEDALSDPAVVDASVEDDVNEAATLRLLGWAHTLESLTIVETSPSSGLGESPLAPLFSRLKERALLVADMEGGTTTAARCLSGVADYLRFASRYADSLPLFERALSIREKALGAEHPKTCTSLDSLAVVFSDMGRHSDALPRYERALALRERVLGPAHPSTSTSLNNLALLYLDMGRHADALPLFERALSIREKALGPEHPDTGNSLGNLALVYRATGRHTDALPLYERALSITEKALGPEHPATATPLVNLADLFHVLGRHADALPLFVRAVSIREKALGPEHPKTGAAMGNLAYLYQEMGASWALREPPTWPICCLQRRAAHFTTPPPPSTPSAPCRPPRRLTPVL